jgi:hypothetical protein
MFQIIMAMLGTAFYTTMKLHLVQLTTIIKIVLMATVPSSIRELGGTNIAMILI